MSDEALRYPVGRFQAGDITPATLARWIDEIAALPGALRRAVDGWGDNRLGTPYRDGGWTVRQVVHHVADSHLNAVVRLKLALTEDAPTIKPYAEGAWAALPDVAATPVSVSLDLLDALHARWTALLRGLPPEAFARTFVHPENGVTRLDAATGLYAWHGRHHLAHVTRLAERMGW